MSFDSFSRNIHDTIYGSILELFEKIDDEIKKDYDNFVTVDGEEADYGVIRYMHNNECVMVEYNLAGDDIEYVYTKYAIDNIIQPKFNFRLDIPCLEDSSPDNCVAHFMVLRFNKYKSQIGTIESILSSTWLDETQKKEIVEEYKIYESFLDKIKP